MEILLVVLAIVVLGLGAMASAGGLGGMRTEPVRDTYVPPLPTDRPVSGADLEGVRFDTAARGYDMASVDAVMARMARELEEHRGTAPRATDAVDVAGDAPALSGGAPPAEAAEPAPEPEAAPVARGLGNPERVRRTFDASRPADASERANAWRGRADRDPEREAADWRPDDA